MGRVLDCDWLERLWVVARLELLEWPGRHGCFVAVHRRGTWLGRLVGKTRMEISQWRARFFYRWHWFGKTGSGKLCGFSVIHMNRAFYFAIFINHLILVGYAADTIGSFPSGCQLGGAFGRGGESED